jgi:hypothetical protein
MKPSIVWLSAEAELPVRVKRTIASEKCMPMVFLGIQGITYDCWLPEDSILDSIFFCEGVFDPAAQKFQPNPMKNRNPFPLIHMDARVHTARVTQDKLDVSRLKRRP